MADAKSGCLKGKTLSRAMLRPRRRQSFLKRQRLCRHMGYAYPGSILLLPMGNLHSPEA